VSEELPRGDERPSAPVSEELPRIRVGIVGVGWGSVVITPAFRAVDDFEVRAICSRRSERVSAAAEKLGIAETSTHWEEFVRRDDLDLIVVATPTDLHRDQAIAALEAGKHVLCEKPVALSGAQAREMLDAAERAGTAHAVCFEGRWMPDRLRVGELIRSRYLGDPYLVRFTSTADYWHPTRGLQSEWMYSAEAGGGYLRGMASHDVDFACAMFGEPVAVCADVRTSLPRRSRPDGGVLEVTADDTSTVLLRMADGGVVVISTCATAAGMDRRTFEAYGSTGTITLEGTVQPDPEGIRIRAARAGDGAPVDVPLSDRALRSGAALPVRRAARAIQALAFMLEDWVPTLRDGAPSQVPTFFDGWRTQRVVDAALASSAGAGWVSLE
jgi:predicted dehydrogenase